MSYAPTGRAAVENIGHHRRQVDVSHQPHREGCAKYDAGAGTDTDGMFSPAASREGREKMVKPVHSW